MGVGRVGFGEFVLDSATRQLLCEGVPRSLPPKALALLELLVARWPSAVSKAEIRDRLWPDTFVSESALTGLVAQVRQALDDERRHARYIRTVYGFGYAFEGEATAIDGPTPAIREGGRTGRPRATAARVLWGDKAFPLSAGTNVLGRDEDVTVSIDQPGISRRHAQIVVAGRDATLEDLDSKNGTFLAGRRIAGPVPLSDGDAFRLGRVSLVFRWPPSRVSTRPEPDEMESRPSR